jgi:rhodanese-related sulfurtransferase
MVGAVGRPDLLGPEHADRLARSMWRSLHEQLLVLPDDLAVYPTHGVGSFCSAPGAAERSTTIGREKATNPLLQVVDEDDFVQRLLGGLGSLPAYFSWLPERNRVGFGPAPEPPLAQLSVSEVRQLVNEGAEVVDVRSVAAYARSHIPAALSDVLRPAFASWLGAVVAPDRPLVFVTEESTDRVELIRQCANIGYDGIAGELAGGINTWTAARLPTHSVELITVDALHGPVLDVRSDDEYRAGHLPGAHHVELTRLVERADEFTDPITVMCGHGERAATAASILARRGTRGVRIVTAGPDEWAAATKQALEIGR